MLIKPTREEAERYIDEAYELALDQSRSGYPTYADGIKKKEDFIQSCRRGMEAQNREILLYHEYGNAAGWIQFYFLEDDGYLQTEIFNIAGNIRLALEEFISYCQENYGGYELYLGFPGCNTSAVDYLTELGWACTERDYNDELFLSDYELCPEGESIVKVNGENFFDFRNLHMLSEGGMYWTCDRLYDALDEWEIWLYYKKEQPAAAIYYTTYDDLAEIFGVDYVDGIFNEDAFNALVTKALNECKCGGRRCMVFFNDEESQNAALKIGFKCIGEYVLFQKEL